MASSTWRELHNGERRFESRTAAGPSFCFFANEGDVVASGTLRELGVRLKGARRFECRTALGSSRFFGTHTVREVNLGGGCDGSFGTCEIVD